MTTLTPELRQAVELAGDKPVEITDPQTNAAYVLLKADVYKRMRQMQQKEEERREKDEAARAVRPGLEDLIDYEVLASCAKEADDSVTLAEVRAATSKIKGSMASVVIEEERAERF
jgi:phosphosulfolactate phosphohydrolase-like enzyme